MTGRSIQELWQDYRFLTRELGKFILKQDMAMVGELLAQRKTLQALIEKCGDRGFSAGSEGRQLLALILQEDQRVRLMMQQVYNRAKHKQAVSQAYDNPGAGFTGYRMDRQY